MVTERITEKIKTSLELFLIQKNNFQLDGSNFDLIFIEPQGNGKMSLTVSLKFLNQQTKGKSITEILYFLKGKLSPDDYLSIFRIDVLSNQESFVKNLNFVFSQVSTDDINVHDYTIGGRYIEFGYLLHSRILDKLIVGKALHLQIDNNIIPAGIKGIDQDFYVHYYTGKGLREIYPNFEQTDEQKKKSEYLKQQTDEFLLAQGYLSKVIFTDIQNVS